VSPLEQAINGSRTAFICSLQSTRRRHDLTVTFKLGTDLDIAQVQVQNLVNQALPAAGGGSPSGSYYLEVFT
jgi:multidrug efflux pump subunit AcrB